jgi:hypothetical protein
MNDLPARRSVCLLRLLLQETDILVLRNVYHLNGTETRILPWRRRFPVELD